MLKSVEISSYRLAYLWQSTVLGFNSHASINHSEFSVIYPGLGFIPPMVEPGKERRIDPILHTLHYNYAGIE